MPTPVEKDWSPRLLAIVAKTDPCSDATLSLAAHLEDAMCTAHALWDNFLPEAVKAFLADQLGSAESARTLAGFLAGIHDLGKASDAFQRSLPPWATSGSSRHGLKLSSLNHKAPHGTTGQLALRQWLVENVGDGPGADALGEVIGGHHGLNPSSDDLVLVRRNYLLIENGVWAEVRGEIIVQMIERSESSSFLADWVQRELPLTTRTLLQAIVILADWIASNTDLFPYRDHRSSAVRAADALDELALLPPWTPQIVGSVDAEKLFRMRFPHLAANLPNEVQVQACRLAEEVTSPCLLLIEARPGLGKTEAGLMAAEVLASRFGQGGLFIGLPTMATANPMFVRVAQWLSTMGAQLNSVNLAHGKAALNADFDRLVKASRSGTIYDEAGRDAGVIRVVSWLRGRKRALLSNFVVGTIDQFLMGGLKAKHLVLRHIALAGKVVVIDEVHAADDYMREYALIMLEWLGRYRTPVILMSATLPPEQREAYVAAYARGGGFAAPAVDDDYRYPRITVFDGDLRTTLVPDRNPRVEIEFNRLDDDVEHLVALLHDSLADGGCAAVIRNTVGRAQEAYVRLREDFGDDVVLLHSRFIAPHRAAREARLLAELGKGGARPHRRIVVGTQVLEQSLDVDFDLMITDLAPIDLVLQRAGRLHRHNRAGRPERVRVPRLCVSGVDWLAEPPRPVRGSVAVYGMARLLRALAVLQPALESARLRVPDAIPALVSAGYAPDLTAPQGWTEAWRKAEDQQRTRVGDARRRARSFTVEPPTDDGSMGTWLLAPSEDPEAPSQLGRAQVRDGGDSIEVIVVQRDRDGVLRLPDGEGPMAGHELPELFPLDDWRLARAMAETTVALPMQLCAGPAQTDATIAALERSLKYDNWQSSPWIAGQLALVLNADGNATVAGFDLNYSSDLGLAAIKRKDTE